MGRDLRRLAAAIFAICAIAGCSPYGGGAFHCEQDNDCAGGAAAGRCEQSLGVCAFADPACPDGYRYGASSGGVSGQCVGGETVDAPKGDGPFTDADPRCFGTGLAEV